MIGLQHIVETFRMEYKSTAERVGVSKQTFQDWVKGRRKIPQQRLEQLSELFGITKQELFQKELSEFEKLEIQMLYFQKTDKRHEEMVSYTDSEGKEYLTKQIFSQNQGVIDFLQTKSDEVKLMESVEKAIGNEVEEKATNMRMLKDFASLLENGSTSEKKIANLVLYYLTDYKHNEFGGIRPEFIPSDKSGFFDKLDSFLQENKLID